MSIPPLSIPEIPPGTTNLAAALLYAECGWYVLPVKRGTKKPGSVVGKRWQDQSSRDPAQIAAWFAGTDHGIALHCGRSGAVVFDVDYPDELPDVLRKHLRGTPFQRTRKRLKGRGHYVFLQPPGRMIGNGAGRLGKDWGQVRGRNGVIIVQPTQHLDSDGQYRWATTGVVAMLPDEIAELLPEASARDTDAATDKQIREFLAKHTTATHQSAIMGPLSRKLILLPTESRHEEAVSTTAWAMEEAAAGCYSAAEAAKLLKDVFMKAVQRQRNSAERRLTLKAANEEWDGILAWAVGKAMAKTPEELAAIRDKAQRNRKQTNGMGSDTAKDGKPKPIDVRHLESGFWGMRESLRAIHTAALSRMCSPWAILGCCSTIALTLVPPTVVLPPIVGDDGSLNMFCILAASSGGGKSAALAAAKRLMANHPVLRRNIGSGEGMVESYYSPRMAPNRQACTSQSCSCQTR